jgi:hypothetical protein
MVLLMELGTVARETSLKDNVVAQSSRIQTDPIIWARQTEMYEYLRGRPCLDPKFSPKFHYAKRRFPVTSKCRHMEY